MKPHLLRDIAPFIVLAWLGLGTDASAMDRLHYQEYPELEGKVVNQVRIFGNNRTREVVFRREMLITEGRSFTSDDLWHDWERLVDLGIFAEIEVDAVSSGEGVLVVISVHERPWWFVAPIIDYDLDTEEITFGYTARVRNFNGLNRQLRSKGTAGGRDRISASWTTPWIGAHRQSLGLDINIDLPRPEGEEIRSSRFTVGTARFLGDYRVLRRSVNAFMKFEELRRDGNAPGGEIDEFLPAWGLGYSRDSRNVRIDPARGSLFSAAGEYTRSWTSNDVSYVRGAADGRIFVSVREGWVIAARARTILSNGEVPQYRKIGVGGSRSIRGQPTDIEKGSNLAVASLELRFPIMARRRFAIPLPFVPNRISNFDLRVDGEFFVDTGTAWDDSVGFRNARLRTGAGFGLRVFLPVLELVRFELAFDHAGSPTFYMREGNLI